MISSPTARFNSQKSRPSCRIHFQRANVPAREARKQSHELSNKQNAYAETSPQVIKVIELASRIASMSDSQVRERYHELVDGRAELNALERFELERIETRLDAEDRDPQLEARERQWEDEGIELINSVKELLAKLSILSA
jgi:ribosome assembly protein YihI (activator of Der GTPase)